jgi:hypothetical protein
MATVKALEAAIKRIDKVEKKTANQGRTVAVKQMPQKSKPKTVKKVTKSVVREQASARGVALPHDCVKEWAAAVANPWEIQGVKIPYNPLSVPTTISTTARVYNTHSITLAASETQQIVMWPGHTEWNSANPLDLVASHSISQTLRLAGGVDTVFVPGPVNYGANVAIQGGYTSNPTATVALGTYNLNTGTAASTIWNAMSPSVALPFTGSTADAHHTRYRLVSLGLVITNTTPELNVSGSIVTVQPDNGPMGGLAATGSQSVFETYPSFKRHPPNKQVKISWIPRGEDLAWTHISTVATSAVLATKAAFFVFLNSGTAGQTYQIDWVANYEVAGNNIRSISDDAVNFPKARETVEPAITAAHLTQPTATKMNEFVHLTAANNNPTTAPASSSISDQISEHAKTLAMHATKLLGQAAGPALKAIGNHAAARLLGDRMRSGNGPFAPGYHPRALTN